MYVDGTAQYPYIGLDLATIYELCRRTGDSSIDQVQNTIAHELGHAWVDSRCVRDENLTEEDEEKAAENLACEWVMYGDVRMELLSDILPDAEEVFVGRDL